MNLAVSTASDPPRGRLLGWDGFLRGSGDVLLPRRRPSSASSTPGLPASRAEAFPNLLPMIRRTFSTFEAPLRRKPGESGPGGRPGCPSRLRQLPLPSRSTTTGRRPVLPLVARFARSRGKGGNHEHSRIWTGNVSDRVALVGKPLEPITLPCSGRGEAPAEPARQEPRPPENRRHATENPLQCHPIPFAQREPIDHEHSRIRTGNGSGAGGSSWGGGRGRWDGPRPCPATTSAWTGCSRSFTDRPRPTKSGPVGMGKSAPKVARWLGDIRKFFPTPGRADDAEKTRSNGLI